MKYGRRSYTINKYKYDVIKNKGYSILYERPVDNKSHKPKQLVISTDNFTVKLDGTKINSLKKVLNEA